jgi:hypothetical protein
MSFVRGHYRRTTNGLVFVQPHLRQVAAKSAGPHIGGEPWSGVALFLGTLVVGTACAFLLRLIPLWIILGAISVCAIITITIVTQKARTRLRRARADKYLDLCAEFARGNLDASTQARLEHLAQLVPADDQARLIGEEVIYRNFVSQVLADARIDASEKGRLVNLERIFSLNTSRTNELKEEAFSELLPAIAGSFFGVAEEVKTRELASMLGIQPKFVEIRLNPLIGQREKLIDEQVTRANAAAERSRAREEAYQTASEVLSAPSHPTINSTVGTRLSKTEQTYYEVSAVMIRRLKRREERRPGLFIVTNRRLLFVGDGGDDDPAVQNIRRS